MLPSEINIIKPFFLSAFAAFLAVLWTPALTKFLYKHKLWRKDVREKSIDGQEVTVFAQFNKERETKVPRFGGLLIWVTTTAVILLFWGLSHLPAILNLDVTHGIGFWLEKLNFLSRGQTWLPLFTLLAAAILGLIDDILQVKRKGRYIAGGLTFWQRFGTVFLIGLTGGWWFYSKLGINYINIPGNGNIIFGAFFIAIFILVMLACWAGGVIDGMDGLAGGAFAIMFAAYGFIAFNHSQIDLAAFCWVLTGTILAFLWFNIPPARFYMSETGSLALTSTLAVVAFLTNSVLVLPIIGGLLVIEAGSVIIQLFWKKVFHRKLFKSAPVHHHLEAIGWPRYKVTMRAWILGAIFAIIGVIIALID